MRDLGICLFAALALLACGGSSPSQPVVSMPDAGSPPPAPGIASFSASPGALPYGGGTATLTWSSSGAQALSIAPGVGDVTGKTTLQVPVTSDTTFTLTASNPSGSITATASVTVSPTATVSGRVIDLRGQPLPSATVVIAGRPSAVADATGQFKVSGVTPPFDAIALAPDQQHVTVYRGLSTLQPTLTVFTTPASSSSATVSGTVSGGATPYTSANTPIALFGSPEVDLHGTLVNASNGTYSLDSSWAGAGATTGTLLVLQPSRGGSGQVTGWLAYGRADRETLAPGASLTGAALALTSLTPGAVAGTVSVPAGYTLGQTNLILDLQPVGTAELQYDFSGSSAFSFNAPLFPQSSCAVAAGALPQGRVNTAISVATSESVTAPTSAMSLTLPQVPVLATPLDGANAVDATTSFDWSAPEPSTVFDLRLTRTGTATPLQLDVITTHPGTPLPDLSSIGVGLGSGATYNWQVTGFAPLPDVDAAAGGDTLGARLQYRCQGSYAASDTRSFTVR